MFDKKYAYHYLFTIGVIAVAGYFSDKVKQGLSSNDAENNLIRQYLLNESPLYGFNRPKLWIHSTYEKNARQWKDFYSRNTTDLNQPYIHLTIKSVTTIVATILIFVSSTTKHLVDSSPRGILIWRLSPNRRGPCIANWG